MKNISKSSFSLILINHLEDTVTKSLKGGDNNYSNNHLLQWLTVSNGIISLNWAEKIHNWTYNKALSICVNNYYKFLHKISVVESS